MENSKSMPEQIEGLMLDRKIGDEELKVLNVSREDLLEADLELAKRLYNEHCDRNKRGQDRPRIDSFLSLLMMRLSPPPEKKKKTRGKTSIIDLHDMSLEGFADDEVSLGRYTSAVKISEKLFRGVKQLNNMVGGVAFGGIQVSDAFAEGMHRDFISRRRFVHVIEGHNFLDGKTGEEVALHLEEEIGANEDHLVFIDTKFGHHQFRIENPLEVSIDWTVANANEPHQVIWENNRPVGRRKWEARSAEQVQEMLIAHREGILTRIKALLKGPKYMTPHLRGEDIKF